LTGCQIGLAEIKPVEPDPVRTGVGNRDTHMTKAVALTVAGSDSGGGAGIQADLKTFSALGVYGASVVTALTAQNTQGVRAIHDVPAKFIAEQLEAVLDDMPVAAVKIGMLSQPEVIAVVADTLRRYKVEQVVLDPVMVATSGDPLLVDEAVDALRSELMPLVRLITPNLPEASVLLGLTGHAESPAEMQSQADQLIALGAEAVLLKGGHLKGDSSADLLMLKGDALWLPSQRIATANTHGTGCTLSSATAAGLAKGHDLALSVTEAKAYITEAIAAADQLNVGRGHGPVHHFHRWW